MKKRSGKQLSDSQESYSYHTPKIHQHPNPKTGIKDCTEEEAIESIKKAMATTGVTIWR